MPNSGKAVTMGQALKIGIVLSGGPAAGGHNVIAGVHDHLRDRNMDSVLIGFIDGPSGIIENEWIVLDEETVMLYRNQGGFHVIGSGRTKVESVEDFRKTRATCVELGLDGLIICGGDDSNSNAMMISEDFVKNGVKTRVIGVPKTIDGDLRNMYIESSFGFDTATKVYSELISNLGVDAISAKKTYHFCRLMGRSASHITLECALQTHPNLVFIGEEVADKKQTLAEIAGSITDLVCRRADMGKNYGLIILPEGLVEFMPDVEALIDELNEVIAKNGGHIEYEQCVKILSESGKKIFTLLPRSFAEQLMLDRDPHGNVQVSKIESERLLIDMVKQELKRRKQAGTYKGKFSAIPHFFGYEGRCSLPTNFDCNYCYTLGHTATALIEAGHTGYVATATHLTKEPENWVAGGFPLTMMMNMERRKAKDVPVIKKALVDLKGTAFKILQNQRKSWELNEDYRCPGPIQHYGPMADDTTMTLQAEEEAEA